MNEYEKMNILFIVVLGIFSTLSRPGLIMQRIPIGSIIEGNQQSGAHAAAWRMGRIFQHLSWPQQDGTAAPVSFN